MRAFRNQSKDRRISSFETGANPDTDAEVGQCKTMHVDLCLKVSATSSKTIHGHGCHAQHENQTNGIERLPIMAPLLHPASAGKLCRKVNNHNECYPKSLNCRNTRSKQTEKQNYYFLLERNKLRNDSRVPALNTKQCKENCSCLKTVLLQTSGGEHPNSHTTKQTPTQLHVQPPSKRLGDPADVASHQAPCEPPQTESIDFEQLSSSQLDVPTQKVNGELSSKQNINEMARNTQEINFERSSRRHSQQIDRNILESNFEPAPRLNSYQRERGAQGMNSEQTTRRNSYQSDRVSHEVNERTPRRNSQQRDKNIHDFGFERSTRRNSNLIDRNLVETNFERSSKRGSNQRDVVLPQYGTDRSLRRNSKQMDIVLPVCQPDRSGGRTSSLKEDTYRQSYYDATAQRESVLMDKGFRNFNKSRWENMAGGKPAKQQTSQRPKQKDICHTDKNTKLNVPKRSSRWETMNIDKLHEPATNSVKRDTKAVGPILKKAAAKQTAQWEQVDRSIQIFSCEQEVPRDVAYQKRAYPQYTNRADRLNCPRMETSSKLFSDQWQRPLKPASVSKIAGGNSNSRWETPRLYDSGSTAHAAQTLTGDTFQSSRQPASRCLMAGVNAQQETILLDHHPPDASPLPHGKPIHSNQSHIPTPIGKTTPRPTGQGCLPSSANSVSISPMLPDNHQIRLQTQKEVIHVDSPFKNSGVNTAGTSGRGLGSTAFSATEHRPEHGGGVVGAGDRFSRSRGQLEVECEVVPMETGMQRSFAGEANLADGSISAELPM